MRISDLISKLQSVLDTEGDLQVSRSDFIGSNILILDVSITDQFFDTVSSTIRKEKVVEIG